MDIFVGNMPVETNEIGLLDLFSAFGDVDGARVIKDKFSGISRGFGFVSMPNEIEALEAVRNIHGQVIFGCELKAEISKTSPRREYSSMDGGS
jgi:RNA recognition motif-containing protein